MTRWTIAKFEFLRFFKWKQELISLGLMLLMLVLTSSWPLLKAAFDKDYQVAVVSEGMLPTVAGYQFSAISAEQANTARQGLGEVWDALIEPKAEQLQITAKKQASWLDTLVPALQQWQHQQAIRALPLTESQYQVVQQLPTVHLSFTHASADDEQRKMRKVVSLGLVGLLMLGFFAGFGFMFTAITSEKQQRVTEQLLTIISSRQWIDGKIIGISLFSLKSMLTYALFGLIALQAAALFKGKGWLVLGLTPMTWLFTLVFIMLGLLVLNSFLAGFAATIDDPNHSSRTSILLAPLLPLSLVLVAMGNLEGALMQGLSWLPLTSYAAMPLRLAAQAVPWWEIALSLGLLLGFLYWLRAAAARLFSLGIQMYGKEPDWPAMRRAIFGLS